MTHAFSPGWFSPARRRAPLVALALTIAACGAPPAAGPEGPEGPPGAQGAPGGEGPQGNPGYAALAESTILPRGDDDCPFGGIRYDVGVDDGANGGVAGDQVLQAGEIDHTDTICGEAAPAGDWYPEGPAGTAVIDTSGGDSTSGRGGYGGELFVVVSGSGGDLVASPTGRADDGLPTPTSASAWLGTNPFVVPQGQTVTVLIIAPGSEATVPDGGVFTYNNASGTNDYLYVRRSGQNNQITGLSIEAGATLVLPRDATYGRSFAALPDDIVNAGTITTSLSSGNRTPLYLAAAHYFGEAGSRIDLRGGPGSSSVAGGFGGDLVILAGRGAENDLWYFSSGGWSAPSGCPTSGYRPGGVYNRGVIDVSPGATGDFDATASRSSAYVRACSGDEVFNEGAIVSRGVGPDGAGGQVQIESWHALFNHGAIDVSGGFGPVEDGFGGGDGGRVYLQGGRIAHGGSIDASGGSIAPTVNCTFGCDGGEGGDVTLQAYGARLDVTGDVDVRGGDAVGSGGPTFGGYPGSGGDVTLSTSVRSSEWGSSGAGAVQVSGDIWAGGGAGVAVGGYGGEVFVAVQGGEVDGAGVSLLGYAEFSASGGDGAEGGHAGQVMLYAGEGGGPTDNRVGEVALSDAIVIPMSSSPGGTALGFVPVQVTGGDASGGDATSYGGRGGVYVVRSRADYAPTSPSDAIVGAPADLDGGAGTWGGRGGFCVADGATLAAIIAPVTSRGGAGATGFGGEGGMGGLVGARSQYDRATVTVDVELTGGPGFYGGEGGMFQLLGPVADLAADVAADGGPGDATSGAGGYGGEINLWSSDTFTVFTADPSADGGAGATPGGPGTIEVDGFIVQSSE